MGDGKRFSQAAQPFRYQGLNCSSPGLASPPEPSPRASPAPSLGSPSPMTQPSTRLYSFLPTLWASHISPLRNRIYYLDKHLGCKDHRLSQAIFWFLLWGGGGGSEGRGTAWNWEGLRHQGSSTRPPPPLPSAHCHDGSQARPWREHSDRLS